MKVDGNDYGSRSVGRSLARHRLAQGDKAKAASDKAGHPKMPGMENTGGGPENEDPQSVVAAHGPAKSIHIEHGENEHTVHSKHEDGHEHHSSHGSAKEAHDHASQLAGVEDEGYSEPTGGEEEESSPLQAMGLGAGQV
jgi:hypothetical protein